ncbi:ABC transporter permease [Serinibacter arcticus]|uniref:ABC transporter permease n=1 Tax=Serinibacter arcticus TaxID=1655435 RepID=A0A2U1ZUV3_9MICO|nr:ABC transporter permease [Serinibacter arcticus]PWD50733.1 ABC transporter permease [Serinibacter arcticus]
MTRPSLPPGLTAEAFGPAHRQVADAAVDSAARGFWRDSWERLRRRRAAMVSLVVLALISVAAVVAIWFSPHDPTAQQTLFVNLPPRIPGLGIPGWDGTTVIGGERVDKYALVGVPADVHFLLGTDGLGRDLLSRLLMGVRVSLGIALVAAVLDLTLGVTYGLVSGLAATGIDTAMQRVLEVLSGIPTLVVLVLMLTVFSPGVVSIVLALVVTGWIPMARLVRAQTLRLKDREFVLAAEVLGARRFRIAVRHVLPNVMGVVVVQTMFTIPTAIFFEAFLSFIGLGLRPPTASLGTLLDEGFDTFTFLPYQMLVPALTLSVIMIAFNLLADGLRDAFDPRSRR